MTTSWIDDLIAECGPEFAAAVEAELAELQAADRVMCAWGWCVQEVSSTTGKILGAVGPMACPCDLLPGWRSAYPAGLPKPPVPVKARGRHGSRRQRSVARRRLLDQYSEYLPT